MKKIILMLMATFCWNELNASVVNVDMTPFKTNGSKTDGGKSKVWFSTLNYKRAIFKTKNGAKINVINRISHETIKKVHELFPKLKIDETDSTILHNGLVKFLNATNRKTIYIHEPINNRFAEPTVHNINRVIKTRDYVIIPVTLGNSPVYLEIIAFRKGLKEKLHRGVKYDDSNITIKVTKPSGADSSTDGAEEDEGNEEDEA